jgi:3-methyl-2-oxobutanoate hydroxymethyltransferase
MLNVVDFLRMKQEKEKIAMITAYDFPAASQAEQAGVDVILVGDSLGMVVLGYSSTTEVTMNDMIHHAKAVRRGAKETFIIVDMPFMSYHASFETAIQNATILFQQTNAQAIKLEGASEETITLTEKLTAGGIPVVGHLGLTPQTVNVLGGYRVQGKDEATREQLLMDAQKLAEAGAVLIVFECIPKELAAHISESIHVPTIGIGAGVHCDGQVLVYHDILQYGTHRLPKFVKSQADLYDTGIQAIESYVAEVKSEAFPEDKHSFLSSK